MIVTTSYDETPQLVESARQVAEALAIPYVKRYKETINGLLQKDSQLFVVNSHRGLTFYQDSDREIFFHPNMAFLRIKQLESGQKDSFVTATGLKAGMTIFDGTIGLASDALVASYVVGATGKVIGTELSRPLWFLTAYGLSRYKKDQPPWEALIDRIQIKNMSNLEYLKELPDNSVDVVYFDFMFEKSVTSSHGIQVIKPIAISGALTPEHIQEAKRVAKTRIVAKSGYSGTHLTELGFTVTRQNQRKNFYYGTIETN